MLRKLEKISPIGFLICFFGRSSLSLNPNCYLSAIGRSSRSGLMIFSWSMEYISPPMGAKIANIGWKKSADLKNRSASLIRMLLIVWQEPLWARAIAHFIAPKMRANWTKVIMWYENSVSLNLSMDMTNPRIVTPLYWIPSTCPGKCKVESSFESTNLGYWEDWQNLSRTSKRDHGKIGISVSEQFWNSLAYHRSRRWLTLSFRYAGKELEELVNPDRLLRARSLVLHAYFAHPTEVEPVIIMNAPLLSLPRAKTFAQYAHANGDNSQALINPYILNTCRMQMMWNKCDHLDRGQIGPDKETSSHGSVYRVECR